MHTLNMEKACLPRTWCVLFTENTLFLYKQYIVINYKVIYGNRYLKTNLTTKCFVRVCKKHQIDVQKLLRKDLTFRPLVLIFTSLAWSSTSDRKILWATSWWVTQLFCCFQYISRELQITHSLITLKLTHIQLKKP